ncbi:DUF4376 domain-containing protein [Escherichia coli]
MKIEKIISPVWGDPEHTIINCMVKFTGFDEAIPFTASADDIEDHGREIFAACQRGEDGGEIGEYIPQPAMRLEEARAFKNDEINTWRNQMESAGYVFEFEGRRWDYGKETQERLALSVSAAKAGKLPEKFFWTDADNNDVPMTPESLIALSEAAELAMFDKSLEIHIRQRTMKKEIESMDDADVIMEYTVGMGE